MKRILCTVSLAAVIVMTAVEGTWGTQMHSSPFFVAAVFLLMALLAVRIVEELRLRSAGSASADGILTGLLSHCGAFVLCLGSLLGSLSMADVHMVAIEGQPCDTAYSRDGSIVRLPFSVTLKEFRTDYYEDGVSPKQYSSTFTIDGSELQTSVNHPCRYGGYRFYQLDYDRDRGEYSLLKLVRDPWIPLAYAGMALLAAGALLQLRRSWKGRWLFAVILAVAAAFTLISVARINLGTLVPALRSLWFIPHLSLYMIAFASLAIALVLCILALSGVRPDRLGSLASRLSSTASSLLLLGMTCGAVWAKAAWGHWWTWDAKECWAAVTWLLTVAGTHLPDSLRRRRATLLVSIILAFLAMQIAWYGVGHLPASLTSLHTYR